MNIRPEVTKCDEWIRRRMILDDYSPCCSFGRDEHLILSHLTEPDQRWAINVQLAETPVPLRYDETGRTWISQNAFRAGLYRQLLRTEALFAGYRAIDHP